MSNPVQLVKALKRARAIAVSGDYDEDCVRRLLQGLEDELKEAAVESELAESFQGLDFGSR